MRYRNILLFTSYCSSSISCSFHSFQCQGYAGIGPGSLWLSASQGASLGYFLRAPMNVTPWMSFLPLMSGSETDKDVANGKVFTPTGNWNRDRLVQGPVRYPLSLPSCSSMYTGFPLETAMELSYNSTELSQEKIIIFSDLRYRQHTKLFKCSGIKLEPFLDRFWYFFHRILILGSITVRKKGFCKRRLGVDLYAMSALLSSRLKIRCKLTGLWGSMPWITPIPESSGAPSRPWTLKTNTSCRDLSVFTTKSEVIDSLVVLYVHIGVPSLPLCTII